MGDDYDCLCKDILHELNIMFASGDEEKIRKKFKRLEGMLTSWNRRKIDFEKYRK